MDLNLAMLRNLLDPLCERAAACATSACCRARRPTARICTASRSRPGSGIPATPTRTSTGCTRTTSGAGRPPRRPDVHDLAAPADRRAQPRRGHEPAADHRRLRRHLPGGGSAVQLPRRLPAGVGGGRHPAPRAAPWCGLRRRRPRPARRSTSPTARSSTSATLWPALADVLGVETGPDEPCRLATYLPEKAEVWDRIVARHGLRPIPMPDLLGESHHYADLCFNYGADGRARPRSSAP